MRILINALSGNGDALMFSPILKILKVKLPNYFIDMVVMFKSVSEMYRYSPYINQIYHIDFLKQSKFKSLKQLSEIRKTGYDISVNVYPSNRIEYNIVNYFTGAGKRLGHKYINAGLLSGEFLNNVSVKEVKDRHNVLQNFDLIKKIVDAGEREVGGLEIFLSEEDENSAQIWKKKSGIEEANIIGFHAGSALLKNHINKRWDYRKYAELGNILISKYKSTILLFGTETDLNNRINELIGGRAVLASTENYMDSMARLKLCRLFVSNDTAFLHSAAAFSVPTAAIFGYTNHKELFPWKNRHVIIRRELECSPCFYNSPKPAGCKWSGADEFKCIRGIEVEEVNDACEKLLAGDGTI